MRKAYSLFPPSQSSLSFLPLSTAVVFKPNNYSNSNNNHHLLNLFFYSIILTCKNIFQPLV